MPSAASDGQHLPIGAKLCKARHGGRRKEQLSGCIVARQRLIGELGADKEGDAAARRRGEVLGVDVEIAALRIDAGAAIRRKDLFERRSLNRNVEAIVNVDRASVVGIDRRVVDRNLG